MVLFSNLPAPRRSLLAFAAIFVTGALGGCRSSNERPPDSPLAVFKGGKITQSRYHDWLTAKNKRPDGDRLRKDLERIAVTLALADAAVADSLPGEPAVAIAVERTENAVLSRVLRRSLTEEIEFSEEELRRAFEGRPDNLYKPKKYRLHEIFLKAPSDMDDETTAQRRFLAEDLRRRLLGGEPIEELAREYSDSSTRYRGGHVGVVEADRLGPEIAAAVSRLSGGDVSDVLRTGDGFIILSCDLVVPERRNTFEESREKVRSILVRREARRRWERLQADLLAEAAPRYDLEAIRDPGTPPEQVVVRYSDGELTFAEARALLGVSSETADETISGILDAFIVGRITAARARAAGLDRAPETASRLRWKRLETLSLEELARRVSQRATPPDDEDVRREIEEHPSRYREPETFLVSAIRLDGEPDDLPQRWKRSKGLVERLRSGELDFKTVAGEVSDHPSAEEGGDLGWQNRAQLGALGTTVAAVVDEMSPGEIRGPIQEGSAVWIVLLHEKRPPRPMERQRAEALARQRLGNVRARAAQLEIEKTIVEDLRITTES